MPKNRRPQGKHFPALEGLPPEVARAGQAIGDSLNEMMKQGGFTSMQDVEKEYWSGVFNTPSRQMPAVAAAEQSTTIELGADVRHAQPRGLPPKKPAKPPSLP